MLPESLDPNIQNIILGVVGNILTDFVYAVGSKGRRYFSSSKKRQNIDEILHESLNEVFETIDWQGPGRVEEICLFLGSPETEAIVRQIFAVQETEHVLRESNLHAIRIEFRTLLNMSVDIPVEYLEETSDQLFNILVDSCTKALTVSIKSGLLDAHEAQSTYRYRMLQDQIAAIGRNIEFLQQSQKLDRQAILKFEEKYRHQVATRHGYITPPFVDRTRKIPINDLYVYPNFIDEDLIDKRRDGILDSMEFLSRLYRAVLLGDPGGGKSTFSRKICYDLATNYDKRLVSGRKITPIIVTLRDYGAQKKKSPCSIVQYINTISNSHYQLEPPNGAFEYLLLNGRVIVIFDGLDELLDTSYRQEISEDVETFCSLYPSVPVLVTSREVGYEQAPLDHKKFNTYRLAPFDDVQVEHYANNWFSLHSTDLEIGEQQTQSFLQESFAVPDLRSNPLLLALMCNIYRGENYIPKNRPDVYERCATMMFERWDKSRSINVKLPFEAQVKPAMAYLAHWIYSNEDLQSGVTEYKLVEETTDYLYQRRFEVKDEARGAATKFIEFCSGRAWVFTDTGTTKEGERLYQFTHRTFLEYFTADYLTRIYSTPESLLEVLLPRIADREWDIVAQLAFQIQSKRLEDAADYVLTTTIDFNVHPQKKGNMYSFAVRCLEFMVPSPLITKHITLSCLDYCLATAEVLKLDQDARYLDDESPSGKIALMEILAHLLSTTEENRPVVAKHIRNFLTGSIENAPELKAIIAAEISLELPKALNFLEYVSMPHARTRGRARRPAFSQSQYKFWDEVSNDVFQECQASILELSKISYELSYVLFDNEIRDISHITDNHSAESLFIEKEANFFTRIYAPLALRLISRFLNYAPTSVRHGHRFNVISNDLSAAGRYLLSQEPPWVSDAILMGSRRLGSMSILRRSLERRYPDETILPKVTSETRFGVFALIAPFLEISETPFNRHMTSYHETLIDWIVSDKMQPLIDLKPLFLARFEDVEHKDIENSLNRCEFSEAQRLFVNEWIEHSTNLIQSPQRKLPGF